ncbi:methylamine utilization protein [Nostoc sp. 3335mG]|nr:methylamine utilization protein [Nostoc sp. 3335mG]
MTPSEAKKEWISIGCAVLALAGCISAIAAETVTVVQHDRKFQTAEVNIAAGDTIRFTNEDPFIHQLFTQSDTFNFNTEEQATGVPLEVAFPVAGSFEVLCKIHPRMRLTVNVE